MGTETKLTTWMVKYRPKWWQFRLQRRDLWEKTVFPEEITGPMVGWSVGIKIEGEKR